MDSSGDGLHDATMVQLARAFGVCKDSVEQVRKRGDLFSFVDVTMLVTGNNARYAATEICTVCHRHREVSIKVKHLKFPGRGQRETPVGDATSPPGIRWSFAFSVRIL